MSIKDGEIASSDEVMNAMGSIFNDAAQNLFNADYIGFDSRLYNSGVPNLKNVKYDIFTTDTATTKTNFTYDSTDDFYSANLGVASATLEIDFGEVEETITNIISVINMGDAKTYTDNITNNSFEDVVGAEWTYNEQDGNGVFTDTGRTNAQAKIGSWSYAIDSADAVAALSTDFAEIQQTVDLTNATNIGVYIFNSTNINPQQMQIVIDNTVVSSTNTNTGSGSWRWVSATIPKSLRASGKVLKLRVQRTGTNLPGGSLTVYFDYLDIWNVNESIAAITLAADGTNFEAVENKKILRPSNTGDTPKLRVVLTKPATGEINPEVNIISEEAVKFNMY